MALYLWQNAKEVAAKLREVTRDIDTGAYIEPAQYTVAEWMQTYLAEYTTVSYTHLNTTDYFTPNLTGRYCAGNIFPYQSFVINDH